MNPLDDESHCMSTTSKTKIPHKAVCRIRTSWLWVVFVVVLKHISRYYSLPVHLARTRNQFTALNKHWTCNCDYQNKLNSIIGNYYYSISVEGNYIYVYIYVVWYDQQSVTILCLLTPFTNFYPYIISVNKRNILIYHTMSFVFLLLCRKRQRTKNTGKEYCYHCKEKLAS